MRAISALFFTSQILIGSLVISARAATTNPNLICKESRLAVAIAEGQPANYEVFGRLCYKPNNKNIVHLLIHGGASSHLYWDFPLSPEKYSYVRKLTQAGYATFNFDRIGIGQSDHPPADLVTIQANAFVTRQIVQALRDGRLGTFSKVILVGHSLGSGIAIVEAGQYGDVDGVILMGFLHATGPGFLNAVTSLYPAQNDPRFAGQNLPGYFTSIPGMRSFIYWTPNTDPDVMALEELAKETITTGELNTFPPIVLSPASSLAIHVPVLIVIGQYDDLFCTPPQCPEAQVEPGYYSPDAQVEVMVIPNAGHMLNLHRNAPSVFATVLEWSNRRFGN
jgi:pimeloyl-ACP methyl ester carboxylesterase